MPIVIYGIDGANNKIETLTKEQILDAIAQAQSGHSVLDYDDAFISKIKELNHGNLLQFWIGTQAEYNAIQQPLQNVIYIISDDQHREELEESIAAVATNLNNEITAREGLSSSVDVLTGRVDGHDTAIATANSNINSLQRGITNVEKKGLTLLFSGTLNLGGGTQMLDNPTKYEALLFCPDVELSADDTRTDTAALFYWHADLISILEAIEQVPLYTQHNASFPNEYPDIKIGSFRVDWMILKVDGYYFIKPDDVWLQCTSYPLPVTETTTRDALTNTVNPITSFTRNNWKIYGLNKISD